MPAFAPDILAQLRGHHLIKAVRVVQHDETPFGKIETISTTSQARWPILPW